MNNIQDRAAVCYSETAQTVQGQNNKTVAQGRRWRKAELYNSVTLTLGYFHRDRAGDKSGGR